MRPTPLIAFQDCISNRHAREPDSRQKNGVFLKTPLFWGVLIFGYCGNQNVLCDMSIHVCVVIRYPQHIIVSFERKAECFLTTPDTRTPARLKRIRRFAQNVRRFSTKMMVSILLLVTSSIPLVNHSENKGTIFLANSSGQLYEKFAAAPVFRRSRRYNK